MKVTAHRPELCVPIHFFGFLAWGLLTQTVMLHGVGMQENDRAHQASYAPSPRGGDLRALA
jgi:hypothetical protein